MNNPFSLVLWAWPYLHTPLFYLVPIIGVPGLVYVLRKRWLDYIRYKEILRTDWALLEIIMPKNVFKSPQSMEVVFGAFQQTYAGTWWTRLTQGTYRTWFSLEMVSLEGKVHFYIRTLRFFKDIVETQIYGQYPDVEIREAEDYTHLMKYGIEPGWELAGHVMKLAKDDAYPIKTYVDYGLDNLASKEETKTDPLNLTIEYLGSLGKGEYAFIQILVMAAKARFHKPGTWFGKQDWHDEGLELIKKISKQDEAVKAGKSDAPVIPAMFKLTPGETEIVKAVERSLGKVGFDCGIRRLYAAKKEDYKLSHQLGLGDTFKQYNTLNLNSFKGAYDTSVESVWKLFIGQAKHELSYIKHTIADEYRNRVFFYPPFAHKYHHKYKPHPFVLNTEELATIFHIPGGVTTTGGLPRIESKKAEAPTNLPI
ncbi:MAG TPA: hypothetical protein VJG48_00755 [Candidatus Paceibacterota bacterium]